MASQTFNCRADWARTAALMLVALLLALCGVACDPESLRLAQSPADPPPRRDSEAQTWIEFPREAQTLPIESAIFVAYATDPQNVVQIDLRVNGQALPAGQLRGIDANNGYRLVRLDYTWQPPAQGQYILEARARNSVGTYGAPVYVKFCVGACQPAAWTPTPAPRATNTATPAPASPTWTPTPAAYSTWTPTPARLPGAPPTLTPTITRTPAVPGAPPTTVVPPQPSASINFRSDAPYVNGGGCTTLRWDVDNAQAVFLDGQAAIGHGTRQVCPCAQTTYTLRVIKRDNTAENRQVTIGVYGVCPAPPAPPTTAVPPAPPTTAVPPAPPTTAVPPAPADNTGPSISNVRLDQEGCQLFGRANITDSSGVSQAKFWYNIGGAGWHSLWMSNKGGNLWEAEAGIKITGGVLNFQLSVWANDKRNNEQSSASFTKTVAATGCGGY